MGFLCVELDGYFEAGWDVEVHWQNSYCTVECFLPISLCESLLTISLSPSIRPLTCTHTDVRIDTSLQEDAGDKDDEDENEEGEQQPVISMNLALGPVDETLAAALEGDEGGEGGQQQQTVSVQEVEDEEEEEGEDDYRTRTVVSLLREEKEAEGKEEEKKEKETEKEEGKAKAPKKALIQELS